MIKRADEATGEALAASDAPIAGGGAIGALIRTKQDWNESKLGHPSTWPQSLRTALSIALSSRFPMIIFWGEHLCALYNDAYVPIFGAKHPTVLGKTGLEAWGEVWDVIYPMFERVRRGEATWSEDQLLGLRRRGFTEEAYFTWSYSPIADESGGVGGVFTAVQETTARVLGERRLAILRELGEQAAEVKTVGDAVARSLETLSKDRHDIPFAAVYLAEGDGGLQRFARAGAFAVDDEQMPEEVREDDPWSIAQVASTGAPLLVDRTEIVLPGGPWPEPSTRAKVLPIAKPGQTSPYGVLIAGISPRLPFDDAYGSFLRLASQHIASAIANAVAYEEERRRVEALAEIDRAKTTFFSNVSHEFRTPLTLMLAPIEEMRAQPATPEDRERLELLHRNALRLLKLVNTLLDFSRIEAGRIEASYTPTDLAALTVDLASSFRSAFERAGLTLLVDCPPLPEPVYVDRDMWEKIVLNLLSNAFKFTFEGGVTVRVRAEDQAAVLEVADTGVGIPEHELPKLFERFHRIEGARSRSHEGSGIGLALVHELVRLHGAEIGVKSEVGRGTTLSVRLRLGTAHLPAERIRVDRTLQSTTVGTGAYVQEALRWLPSCDRGKPSGDGSEPSAGVPGSRTRIVVADDNADMRDYVARLLSERWQVEAVADGEAALAAIRRSPPDLVLADVMMPRVDGFGLLRAIREDVSLRATPVVLLSARAGEEATSEGLCAGADDYLVKPFSARDLLVRVAARLTAAKARVELREQRAKLLRAFIEVPFPMAILRGPSHVIEAMNDTALQVSGRPATIIGTPLLNAFPELRGQKFPGLLDEVLRTGKPYIGRDQRVLVANPVGGGLRELFFSFVYAPIEDSDGAIEGILVRAFEVTNEVRTRAELEAANRAKDEFLATMSHELRTPLTAILGWTTILKQAPHSPEKVGRALEVIERNARAQERIVSDLLDVSRIVSGKLQLSLRRTEIAGVVRAAADVVRPAASTKGVRLVVDIAPDVGATMADADRLQQVMWNLLTNAVRFTPHGGGVTVIGERLGSTIRLRVKDNGAGIPSAHLPFVFDRFRQVDSSITRTHRGLGLGLAIVRYLVEAHGGTVGAESEGEGRGATFTVLLPVRPVDTSEPAATVPATREGELSASTQPPAPGALAGVSVLVVEDEADSLELIRDVLERAGASVIAATSARRALETRGFYNIIVSDIALPEMDGYSLIRQIRTRKVGGDVPALALTAYARAEDAARAMRAGYQEHLTKPIDATRLVDVIRRLCRCDGERLPSGARLYARGA